MDTGFDAASRGDRIYSGRRLFWGINHTTLRRFEAELIRHLGFEIFVPKVIPEDESNKSASVDYSYDATLTIPPADLAILNEQDYYSQPLGEQQIELLNRHFDIAIIAFFPMIFDQFARFFRGKLLLRPFGLAKPHTYMDVCRDCLPSDFFSVLERARERFYFAQAFPMLSQVEHGVFQHRAVTLPLGLPVVVEPGSWTGGQAKLLFVCPRVNTSPYYRAIYDDFNKSFGDLPHTIAGAQPIEVTGDPSVSGYVSREKLNEWLRSYGVMYYHSTEPRHLHYHPLEALQAGMPLVFRKESMLYELGGRDQPGACATDAEARATVRRLLDGDLDLARRLVSHQRRILDTFSWDHCLAEWKRVLEEVLFATREPGRERRRRIGVFLPIAYRGGTLNTAINQALMLKKGALQSGEEIDVVFSYVTGDYDVDRDFRRLTEAGIPLRETAWRETSRDELLIAHKFLGMGNRLDAQTYCYPSDGGSDFLDCDFWYLVTDRTETPLAPLRPYSVFVTDCLQRYMPDMFGAHYEAGFHATTRGAALVLCSMPFNRDDLIQYVGLASRKIALFPLFNTIDMPTGPEWGGGDLTRRYFVWPTNVSAHKNHEVALRGIRRYLERYDGAFDVLVTGVDTDKFDPRMEFPDLPFSIQKIRRMVERSRVLRKRIAWLGNLEQDEYAWILGRSQFLFHPTLIDAGTLAAMEAASLGVPTLSNDYPPMRYYDERFNLNISFFDGKDEAAIGRALKRAEENIAQLKRALPTRAELDMFSLDSLAPELWKTVQPHVQ